MNIIQSYTIATTFIRTTRTYMVYLIGGQKKKEIIKKYTQLGYDTRMNFERKVIKARLRHDLTLGMVKNDESVATTELSLYSSITVRFIYVSAQVPP